MSYNTTTILNDTTIRGIFNYQVANTGGNSFHYVVVSFYIVILGIMLKRNVEKNLAFYSASVLTFLFTTIMFIGGKSLNVEMIKEEFFIAIVLLFIFSNIAYFYNERNL